MRQIDDWSTDVHSCVRSVRGACAGRPLSGMPDDQTSILPILLREQGTDSHLTDKWDLGCGVHGHNCASYAQPCLRVCPYALPVRGLFIVYIHQIRQVGLWLDDCQSPTP